MKKEKKELHNKQTLLNSFSATDSGVSLTSFVGFERSIPCIGVVNCSMMAVDRSRRGLLAASFAGTSLSPKIIQEDLRGKHTRSEQLVANS